MGELEELASKAERERLADDAARRRDAERAKRNAGAQRDDIYENSIGLDVGTMTLVAGLFLAIAGSSAIAVVAPRSIALWIGFGVGVVSICGVGAVVLQRRARVVFERWLAQLPFAFDRDRYRAALSEKRSGATVTIRVRFASRVAEADRLLLEGAARGALKESRATLAGDELVITSPSLKTHFHIEDVDYHHNRKVHLWVRRCFDRALRAIHARYAIQSVDLRIG